MDTSKERLSQLKSDEIDEVMANINWIYNLFTQMFYDIVPYSHEYYLGIINDEDYIN